jgi:RHS repeat-associated protein
LFGYDNANRTNSIAHRNATDASNSTLLAQYTLTRDNAGRIAQIDSSLDGISGLGYDKTNQLTTADHAAGRTDEAYSFDANGNRTNSGYSTGTGNRLLSDGTYNYLYDKEGNRTRRTLISNGSYEQYTWDHRNRLTKVEFKTSGGSVTKWVSYSYDVYNRLVRRQFDPDGSGSQAASNTFYTGYDGIHPTLEFDGTTKDDVSHRYVWFPSSSSLAPQASDLLLADEQVSVTSSPGNTLWALADHLGTIRDIADYNESNPAFSIANHRVYDSFGRLESETNSSVDLSLGFTGKQFDDQTGLNNYLNRWYDARVGRWLSEDPLSFSAGDTNLTRYVGNSPTLLTDPLGLAAFDGEGAATITSESALNDDENQSPTLQEPTTDDSGQSDSQGPIIKPRVVLIPSPDDPFRPIIDEGESKLGRRTWDFTPRPQDQPYGPQPEPSITKAPSPLVDVSRGFFPFMQGDNTPRVGKSGNAAPSIPHRPRQTLWEEAVEELQRPYDELRPFDWTPPKIPIFGWGEEAYESPKPHDNHHDSDDHDHHTHHHRQEEAELPKPAPRPKRGPPPEPIPPPTDDRWFRIFNRFRNSTCGRWR